MFEDWLYLTQCVQALCLRVESEHYRRLKGDSVRTMGALYWQLNSIWPAPTWSSLEYGNRWKVAHYFAKEFFAETIISSFLSSGDYSVYVTTDGSTPLYGTWVISLVRWSDGQPIKTWKGDHAIPSYGSVMVFQENLDAMFSSAGVQETQAALTLQWNVPGQEPVTNQFFPTSLSVVTLPYANLLAQVSSIQATTAYLQVTCSAMAPFTFLEINLAGRFSQNGFLCLPSSPVSVLFSSEGDIPLSIEEFQRALRLKSIRDTY
jgi:beta-mannosidase